MDRRNYGSMAATAAVVEDDADPDSEEEEAGFRVVLEKVPSEGSGSSGSGSSRFQPGEGPIRGLLPAYEPSDGTF